MTSPAVVWPEPAGRASRGLLELLDEDMSRRRRISIAPGRVNLLGGHTDYNDGFVLPVAVDRYVSCAFAEGVEHTEHTERTGPKGKALEFVSLDFGDRFMLDITDIDRYRESADAFERLTGGPKNRWRRYVAGVVIEMEAAGSSIPTGLGVIAGDVPLGSGLSSSAALEAAVYLALNNGGATPEAALLCQRAENRWVGVPCGVMDQFTSFMAEAGKALFLDCRDLTWRNIPLPAGTAVTVIDSGVQRELADGEYLKRRQEIETSLTILRKVTGPLESLRDLSPEVFEEVEDILPEPLRSRVQHVVDANARVREGVTRLVLEESEGFGELMVDCHLSLAHLYEVSTSELDLIVERSLTVDGVFGARLTGAGFGGCCVVFHREGCEGPLRERVEKGLESEFGRRPTVHHLHSADGAGVYPIEDQI